MPYRQRTSQGSNMQSHSNEIERRLTLSEAHREYLHDEVEYLKETQERHHDRLTLHERVLLMILGVLGIVLQDKFPQLAALLKGVRP